MVKNKHLNKAKKEKNNEFYTRLEDIKDELQYYTEQLENKIIYCNCDNPFESNFVKYFVNNFTKLKLKKLIATCCANSENGNAKPYKAIITYVPDGVTDICKVLESNGNSLTILNGDGDFRSQECIELLQQADIVVTNPPFSLFREYIAQLMEHNKQFLVIGNSNAIAFRDVFIYIAQGNIRPGNRWINTALWARTPRGGNAKIKHKKIIDDVLYICVSACWYTTLYVKRQRWRILKKSYHKHKKHYIKFDNYDAININNVADIPYDYDGVMGVPITFLDEYNPEQFELVQIDGEYKAISDGKVNGKKIYKRILIRNKYPCHTNL